MCSSRDGGSSLGISSFKEKNSQNECRRIHCFILLKCTFKIVVPYAEILAYYVRELVFIYLCRRGIFSIEFQSKQVWNFRLIVGLEFCRPKENLGDEISRPRMASVCVPFHSPSYLNSLQGHGISPASPWGQQSLSFFFAAIPNTASLCHILHFQNMTHAARHVFCIQPVTVT